MGWGAWKAAVHGVAKSRTRLRDFTFTFHFHALEKAMATHSCVLAWRIPGTGEPGGLPSMGSHRVGHDWSDLAAAVNLVVILPKPHSLYLLLLLQRPYGLMFLMSESETHFHKNHSCDLKKENNAVGHPFSSYLLYQLFNYLHCLHLSWQLVFFFHSLCSHYCFIASGFSSRCTILAFPAAVLR